MSDDSERAAALRLILSDQGPSIGSVLRRAWGDVSLAEAEAAAGKLREMDATIGLSHLQSRGLALLEEAINDHKAIHAALALVRI